MSLWRQLTHGMRWLLRPDRRRREIAEEIDHYYSTAEQEFTARGMTAEQARRAARLADGRADDAQFRASTYGWEQAPGRLWASLRFAGRQLWKHPAFSVTAMATLALGIGANTAVFTVIEQVLLAPLPYAHAQRICILETHYTDRAGTKLSPTFPRVTGPDAVDVRTLSHSIAAVSLYGQAELGVQARGHSVYTGVALLADAAFTRVMGVGPIAGSSIPNGASYVAMVSDTFARDNFGNAQAALHQTLHIEDRALTIVGVLPGWFSYPDTTQIWAVTSMQPATESRTAFNYKAVALLRPGVTLQTAQRDLTGLSRRLQLTYPKDNRAKELRLAPLRQALTGDIRPTLLLLWAAVALVLLIACVNVTHLQLVRAMERQREIAVRKALGASRWQVLEPVLMESLLIALLGAGAGVLLALPAVRLLLALAPAELPHASRMMPDGRVLAFTLAIAVFAAILSSLLPARNAAKADPGEALKRDTSRGMRKPGAARLRDGMVLAEVTVTFVLAVGAGLLLHTMAVLMTRDLGYNTQRLLVVDADIPAATLAQGQQAVHQFSAIFHSLRETAGVEAAGGIMGLPMSNYGSNGYYQTRGGLPQDPNHPAWANFSVASPRYFETMQIPLREGRGFTDADLYTGGFVAVISQSLAKQSFGNVDPVGRQIQCGLDSDKWMRVVGVVGDVRQDTPAAELGPTLYMPLAQHPFMANQIHIVLRTRVKPLTLMREVRSQIVRVNPLTALKFTTMDTMVDTSPAAERFRAALLSLFAAIGLILAMLGVYGTLAYTVAQRTFEIGLRMALGADRGVIVRGLLGRTALLALGGIAVGIVLSAVLARLVRSMLVGVTPLDPLSLVAAALLLLGTALAAAFVPGWRAARVDPTVALRTE